MFELRSIVVHTTLVICFIRLILRNLRLVIKHKEALCNLKWVINLLFAEEP